MYQNPSIEALAKAVSDLATSPSQTTQIDVGARVTSMQALVKKYSSNFPKHVTSATSQQTGDILLVTGTTGALGATILAKAVQDPSVEKIYAVNRKGLDGRSLIDRQRTVLEDRGLDLAILESPKVVLVETDLNADNNLGLQSATLEEVRDTNVNPNLDDSPLIDVLEPFSIIRSAHRLLISSTMVSRGAPFLTDRSHHISEELTHLHTIKKHTGSTSIFP